MISSCAARLAIGITLVSLYMCVYLTHQSSVPYLTTPFTWRTNSVAEVLGTESITNISTGDLLRKLRCDQDIVYDAVTSWTGSNVSPSCTCIHEKIVVPTVAGNGPSQEDMRRIILRCLLNKHSSEIEYAMSWNVRKKRCLLFFFLVFFLLGCC